MADRGKKDSTPPPLVLMPAGGGLTLNPPDQPNVLMPVIQSEPSLLGPDEEGEADSFVGQGPPVPLGQTALPQHTQASTFNYFNSSQSDSMHGTGDFLATAGQQPPFMPPPSSTPLLPPPMTQPAGPGIGSVPGAMTNTGVNQFHRTGPPRYAQPPMGTYTPPGVPNLGPPAPTPYSQPPSFQPPHHHPAGPPASGMMPPVSSHTSPAQPLLNLAAGQAVGQAVGYHPVQAHWCYCKTVEAKDVWYPFSLLDSLKLEEVFNSEKQDMEDKVISTIGGRYDINVAKRQRTSIYWEEEPTSVRRCTWFYKREGDNRYVPYAEDFSQQLEEEYYNAIILNTWHKRLEFPDGETIVMHNPNVIVHFQATSQPDEWGNVQGDQMRPRVVKRGVEDFETIEDGESPHVDHLVFFVHGIGANCDAKFRSLVECVDDFRSISHTLIESHFQRYKIEGRVHRVEFLPVHWHGSLHSDATGIDKRLKGITLPSTPKLRHFVNDTLMDILFYTSPSYCQLISKTVGDEMNRLYGLFLSRNPSFKGTVSVAGHSLGSSILFDLLLHQKGAESEDCVEETAHPEPVPDDHSSTTLEPAELSPPEVNGEEDSDETTLTLEELLSRVGLEEKVEVFRKEQIDMESLMMCSEVDLKDLGLPMGPRKKLQGILKEEAEKKDKKKKHAEQEVLRRREENERKTKEEEAKKAIEDIHLQDTSNISVNYMCALAGTGQPIVDYPQIDFPPACLFAMGSPIGVFLSVRGVDNVGEDFKLPSCPRVINIFHPFDPVAYRLEPLVNPAAANIKPVLIPHHKGRKRLHLELKDSLTRVGLDLKNKLMDSIRTTWTTIHKFAMAHKTEPDSEENLQHEMDKHVSNVIQQLQETEEDNTDTGSVASSHDEDMTMGYLNEGRRVDYVLQEKPIESFNDYLFALASHLCYWESEDTVLLLLKELYSPYGIAPQMPGPESVHQRVATTEPPHMGAPLFGSPLRPPPSQGPPMPPPPGFSPGPFSGHGTPRASYSSAMTPPKSAQGPLPPTGMSPMQSQHQNGPPPGASPLNQPIGPPPVSGFVRSTPK